MSFASYLCKGTNKFLYYQIFSFIHKKKIFENFFATLTKQSPTLTKLCHVPGSWHNVRWLLWFVGQNADGLIELSEDFLQSWIGLLHDEGGEVLGFTLLHLSGLHNIFVSRTRFLAQALFTNSLKLFV